MKERIQKVLANAGVESRRNVEQLVLRGRIRVNGEIRRELPILVDPSADRIEVDGELIRLGGGSSSRPKQQQRIYILMNKPKGVYCTNVAQGVQKRAIDLLPPDFPYRVYPVGRLDADSRGLLLLTNDGELTNHLTHPRYGIAKTYIAEVDGYVEQSVIERLNRGVFLADKKGQGSRTRPSMVKILNRGRESSKLEVTIREGRNRQVRRMLAGLGHKVRRLTRVKMGPLTLEGVGPGKWRMLTPREVRSLFAQAREAIEAAESPQRRPPRPQKPDARAVTSRLVRGSASKEARVKRLIIGPDSA